MAVRLLLSFVTVAAFAVAFGGSDPVEGLELPPSGGEKHSAFGAWPVVQIPGETYDIDVLRINLPFGKHRTVSGLDFGLLANMTIGRSSGLSFATIGTMAGRGAGLFQIAAVFNAVEVDSSGMQLALTNVAGADYAGVQIGLVNLSGGFEGLQLGVYNQSETASGLQFGLVNVTGELRGVQFGLLNVASASSVPVLPLLHFGY